MAKKTAEIEPRVPSAEQQFCTNCAYFGDDRVSCRRFPPSGGQPRVANAWPIVSPDDWCGEWVWDGVGGGPVPTITSISPTYTNTGSQKISVRGNYFTATSKIIFNNIEQVTTFNDPTWLQATVTKPGIGVYNVLVRDATGDSNSMTFEFK